MKFYPFDLVLCNASYEGCKTKRGKFYIVDKTSVVKIPHRCSETVRVEFKGGIISDSVDNFDVVDMSATEFGSWPSNMKLTVIEAYLQGIELETREVNGLWIPVHKDDSINFYEEKHYRFKQIEEIQETNRIREIRKEIYGLKKELYELEKKHNPQEIKRA